MIIRTIQESDLKTIAEYEIEISIISFGDKAITDINFQIKKLQNSMAKELEGMLVMEIDEKIAGWSWMAPKTNFLSNEKYINFKSFYIAEEYRGTEYVDKLVKEGMKFCKSQKAKTVVSRMHVKNLASRVLWKNYGFEPTHLTLEYTFKDDEL